MRVANHLTMKAARRLAVQELGTASGLVRTPGVAPGFFEMSLGRLKVHIGPELYEENGCVELLVTDGRENIVRLFSPDTLQEDLAAEEHRKEFLLQKALEKWVENMGPKKCCEEVKRTWQNLKYEQVCLTEDEDV